MGTKYQPVVKLLIVAIFSLFWGSLASLVLLWRTIRTGPSRMFSVKKRTRPAVLDDPDLGHHSYVTLTHDPDNKPLKIHYVSKGDEGKPLMLFLHGFPEFWYSWRHQLREFGKDYRAVAMDMRGYGDSDAPGGISSYVTDKLAADVKGVITALGYKSAIVVSHDWGGAVAWSFAHNYPEFVSKLIVCNCGHGRAMAKHLSSSFRQVLRSWYMFMFQVPILPELFLRSNDLSAFDAMFKNPDGRGPKSGTFTAEDLEAYKYTFIQSGFTAPINYYRAAMRLMPAKPAHRKILAPTLVVWGTGDTALGKELAPMSGEYCEDFTLRWVVGASHWVQMEEPELVNNHIREFLQCNESD